MTRKKNKYSIQKSPFIEIKGNLKVFKEDVKDLKGNLQIVKKKYYQSSDYVKIIVGDIIDITNYIKLSKTAKNLLYYIVNILEYNSPTFTLKVSIVAPLIQSETSTVYRAIKELIKFKYIAKTDIKEVYWINHNRFYKGNYSFELYAETKN